MKAVRRKTGTITTSIDGEILKVKSVYEIVLVEKKWKRAVKSRHFRFSIGLTFAYLIIAYFSAYQIYWMFLAGIFSGFAIKEAAEI